MTPPAPPPASPPPASPSHRAVVIGASAGAIQSLTAILPTLPAGYPLPVLVVVHVPAARSDIATLFAARCRLPVREAEDKDPIRPGTITFAPPDYHLLVERDRTLSLSTEPPVQFSRPSIDVTFETAAEAYRAGLTAVVLTGANSDGAAGSAAIARAGGDVLVEDPATAFMPAMPAAALARCNRARPLSLDAIAARLSSLGRDTMGKA